MVSIAPLKKWLVDELVKRENNPNASNIKIPFIMMTSGAKIFKSDSNPESKSELREKIRNILKDPTSKGLYNGCIITNHISNQLNYQRGKTLVGFDFFGKAIEVEGEVGRNISLPIIESMDINTDGIGNTLKTATVNLKCFSLKQFEMFELFFCKAQMDILIEYGDSTYWPLLNAENIIEPKNDYGTFIKKFKELCTPSADEFKKFIKKCENCGGTYDRVAGKLTDYNYSIEGNGIYNVKLTISQGNEYNLALPARFEASYSKIATPTTNGKLEYFRDWKSQILKDLPGLNSGFINGLFEPDWKNEFFNWGKKNEDKIDESASNDLYLSLKFILKILMNNVVSKGGVTSDLLFTVPNQEIQYYRVGDDEYPDIIPITVHKNIISYSKDVIFPNESAANVIVNDKSEIIFDTSKPTDTTINKKSVIVNKPVYYLSTDPNIPIEGYTQLMPDGDDRIGNALNIFISYSAIGNAWEKSISRIDFLTQILDLINANSFGKIKLRYGNIREDSKATVIDVKLYAKKITQKNDREIYRFKPTTMFSNVREFNFNFELPNWLAAQTLYNAQAFLAEIKHGKKLLELKSDDKIWSSIDYASFATANGYYAVNQIQYEQLQTVNEENVNIDPPKGNLPTDPALNKETTLQKIVKFKIGKNNIKTFIVKDESWLYNKLYNSELNNKVNQTPTPIDITLKIDGISGFTCGETFKTDGVPEILNKVGHFYITNIKHNVDIQNGWTTTLEASFRWN
jgi:hypothetical protein